MRRPRRLRVTFMAGSSVGMPRSSCSSRTRNASDRAADAAVVTSTNPTAKERKDHSGIKPVDPGSVSLAGLDQAAFVGEDNGLSPVSQREFFEDSADVRLDGLFSQEQVCRDLGVRSAAGDQDEDLGLPRGQPVEPGRGRKRARAAADEALDQPPGDRRREERVAAATTRTAAIRSAGGASLSRKPLALAASAL